MITKPDVSTGAGQVPRTVEFRAGIEVAAMDGFTGYKTATTDQLRQRRR